MDRVYLVFDDSDGGGEPFIVGIYASRSSAEAHVNAIEDGINWASGFVEEWEVKP